MVAVTDTGVGIPRDRLDRLSQSFGQVTVRLGVASRDPGHRGPAHLSPLDQLQCVLRAFGDTAVLYASYADRPPRPAAAAVVAGTLGERFDAAAEAYRSLSDDQDRLSRQDWRDGPRLVRGVAGSGKTVVLANNLARRLERSMPSRDDVDGGTASAHPQPQPPRLLAVCFNRTLAPFVRRRVEAAYRQRTGRPLPAGAVEVCCFNALTYDLSRRGLWRYQKVGDEGDAAARAAAYLRDLDQAERSHPAAVEAARFDAVYVDEGQDFVADEFRLLVRLCRPGPTGEPDLYVFYDDAQNLYARPRPNWAALDLRVTGGRAHVMTECFRSTRPNVDAAFNVLYGSHAPTGAARPTRDFADLTGLEQKGLVVRDGPAWRTPFGELFAVLWWQRTADSDDQWRSVAVMRVLSPGEDGGEQMPDVTPAVRLIAHLGQAGPPGLRRPGRPLPRPRRVNRSGRAEPVEPVTTLLGDGRPGRPLGPQSAASVHRRRGRLSVERGVI